jgi:hypothetical protein
MQKPLEGVSICAKVDQSYQELTSAAIRYSNALKELRDAESSERTAKENYSKEMDSFLNETHK